MKNDDSMLGRITEIISQAIVSSVVVLRFSPTDNGLVVTRQVSTGALKPILLGKNMTHAITNRLKIFGNLNLAERRRLQVGSMIYYFKGVTKNFRVISLPIGNDGAEEIIVDLENSPVLIGDIDA